MQQATQIRCYYCGQAVNPWIDEDCPYCHYPASLEKEMSFLETSLQYLRRSAAFGGARLTVGDVIQRYASRLDTLRRYKASPMPAEMIIALPQPAASAVEGHAEKITAPVSSFMSAQPAAPRQQRPVFSLRSFLADQTINIVASLGAFLILLGALSFIATTTNLLLSFVIVFAIHALFGGVGLSTYRFRSFRVVSLIYTMIFALLVPLVGFSAYRLIEGHLIEIAPPTLIAVASVYAAIVYGLLAIYQRFKPFAYLGVVALAVADLALARTLGLGYWWWPVMLMLLAFPMLLSIRQPSNNPDSTRGGLFTGRFAILQEPVRLLMFVFVGASVVGILLTTVAALAGLSVPDTQVRFALFTMSLLALAWTSLLLWMAQRRKEVIGVAFLFLASVLAFCYAFDFQAIGYALALTLVALLYHGLSRFAARLLQALAMPGFHLDTIALWLVAVVPVIGSPLLLNQLFARAFGDAGISQLFIDSSLLFHMGWESIAQLIAVILGALLVVDVAFCQGSIDRRRSAIHCAQVEASDQAHHQAHHQERGRNELRPYKPWLLLLAGFLLNVAYSLVVLMLQVGPVWSFLALTIALVALAIVVRKRFGATWANPLDIIALAEAGLTLVLSLGLSLDSIWMLLLFFAACSYGVVLYQRRHRLLFLPLVFALLATPILFYAQRTSVLLVAGVTLPFVCAAIHRLISAKAQPAQVSVSPRLQLPVAWEWPLLCFGLLCGALVCIQDVSLSSSILQGWLGVHIPIAIEIGALALAWYAAAALASKHLWLIPVIAFAVVALVLPANPFWVLVGITPVAALLAVGVSRMAGRTWALPLYSVALLGGIMAGYA
ncbi:MAG TPA: hypothetical protein VGT44_00740, partial [Ktedonobacteraceae bacterium]|nr:hypothetical protein [Ktedonobacteraceae bacterium]